jgi:hypothetical protein
LTLRLAKGKKNRARGAAKSREETPKEGIYSQKTVSDTLDVALHHCQVEIWCIFEQGQNLRTFALVNLLQGMADSSDSVALVVFFRADWR